MAISDPGLQKIINEIFDPRFSEDFHGFYKNLPIPTQESLKEIALLIYKDGSEETYQKFLTNNPAELFLLMDGDTYAGILEKLPIGNSFISDFAIFSFGQGGCRITLIEIEKPSDRLFTKELTTAKKLNTAVGQITEWLEWIHLNKRTFIRDSIELLKKSPKIDNQDFKGNFRTIDNAQLEDSWNLFHGFSDYCIISCIVIIGRWSNLTDDERKRLIFLNSQDSSTKQIRTYDQFIRKSFSAHIS